MADEERELDREYADDDVPGAKEVHEVAAPGAGVPPNDPGDWAPEPNEPA